MALDLITPVSDVFRRDYDSSEDASTGFLKPGEATSLQAGEWLGINSSGKLERPALGGAAVGAPVQGDDAYKAVPALMQSFSQEGDYSMQALSKVTCIQLHNYEAETSLYNSTSTTADGYCDNLGKADSAYTVGAALGLCNTHLGNGLKAVLVPITPATKDWVVGFVTAAPSSGKLRFRKVAPYIHTES